MDSNFIVHVKDKKTGTVVSANPYRRYVTAKGIIHERPPHSGNFFDEAWVPIKTPTSEANVESDDVKAALDQVIHSTSKPVKTKGK